MTILSLDILGLFIFIAGFVIGLGAVTVVDLHGFLGRKSSYWTLDTTRTHKVTNPLIWIGIGLTIIGENTSKTSIAMTVPVVEVLAITHHGHRPL